MLERLRVRSQLIPWGRSIKAGGFVLKKRKDSSVSEGIPQTIGRRQGLRDAMFSNDSATAGSELC